MAEATRTDVSSEKRKWTAKEKYVFLPVIVLVPALVLLLLLVALDLFLHNRDFEGRYGLNTLNVWGYRGEIAPRPEEGQLRIAVLGGSTAWGYGVPVNESMPHLLQTELRGMTTFDPVVVNLAFNNEGAYAFSPNMEDYLGLDVDLVVLYTGVNDAGGENRFVWRRGSPIFRSTGYMPVLPELLSQSVSNLRAGRGFTNPEDNQIVFEESFRGRLDDLTRDGDFDQYLESQRDAESGEDAIGEPPPAQTVDPATGRDCSAPWTFYCEQIGRAVDFALSQGQRVLVVGEPYVSAVQEQQQAELQNYLRGRFGTDTRVTYANFGYAVNVSDSAIAFDGMHLTAAGNRTIAEKLAVLVADLVND